MSQPEQSGNAATVPGLTHAFKVVRWIDSSLQNVQVHVSEIPEPEVITTVGWLVKETDEYVVLARDDHKDDQWRLFGVLSAQTATRMESPMKKLALALLHARDENLYPRLPRFVRRWVYARTAA